jgi:hypothetical protein
VIAFSIMMGIAGGIIGLSIGAGSRKKTSVETGEESLS